VLRDGHFKIHRSTFSHPIVGIARPLRFALWQWMIGEAFFTESGAKSLKRGQFAATNRQLADVVGMPLGTFKTFKTELVEAGMVSVSRPTSARAPSVWTVENYDEYQSKTPNPSPNPSIAINPTPVIQVAMGILGDSETTTQPIAQPIDSHPYKENSRTKTLETPKAPKGAGRRIEDERGHYWPPVPKKGRATYSDPFEIIWDLWLDASAAAGLDREGTKIVKTPDKAKTYELCRMHIADGTVTASDLYTATKNYLDPFKTGREKVGCVHPKTFCRRKLPMFLECIEATTPDGAPLITLAAFKGDEAFALQCARVAQMRKGITPTDWGDNAGWSDFLNLPDDVKATAVAVSRQ
jgi:hypothetical protein